MNKFPYQSGWQKHENILILVETQFHKWPALEHFKILSSVYFF